MALDRQPGPQNAMGFSGYLTIPIDFDLGHASGITSNDQNSHIRGGYKKESTFANRLDSRIKKYGWTTIRRKPKTCAGVFRDRENEGEGKGNPDIGIGLLVFLCHPPTPSDPGAFNAQTQLPGPQFRCASRGRKSLLPWKAFVRNHGGQRLQSDRRRAQDARRHSRARLRRAQEKNHRKIQTLPHPGRVQFPNAGRHRDRDGRLFPNAAAADLTDLGAEGREGGDGRRDPLQNDTGGERGVPECGREEVLKGIDAEKARLSTKAEHPEWFEGLDTSAKTKEDYMFRRAQDRIRTFYYKTKDDLTRRAAHLPASRSLLSELQARLKLNKYHGCYFDRRAAPDADAHLSRLCDGAGVFRCGGRWDRDGCRYGPRHAVNPYSSREERIVFQTWNLDHGRERARTVVPAIVEALRPGVRIDVKAVYGDLFTTGNLKLVHIVCHDKGAHRTMTADYVL